MDEIGGGVDAQHVAGFVTALRRVAGSGGRLRTDERRRCRREGALAVETGRSLPALVDLFLSCARLLWVELAAPAGGLDRAALSALGASIFQGVDDALKDVAEGYAEARRDAVRREESLRHDFLDDLLSGTGEVSQLLSRAEGYGLHLAARHCVVVLGAVAPELDPGVVAADLQAALRTALNSRAVLVTSRHQRLVAIVHTAVGEEQVRPPEPDHAVDVLVRAADRIAGVPASGVVSVSRGRRGPAGIAAGYREADQGFGLAAALGWTARAVHAEELGVFRVLLRDQESILELVESVLGPLRRARGGSAPLVETLYVFLSGGANATDAARRLHLSVRAVTYRLERVRALTGYDPISPGDRLTLHVAVTGARLLAWDRAVAGADLPPSL